MERKPLKAPLLSTSFASRPKYQVPAAVGVPLMVPVAASSLRPSGIVPAAKKGTTLMPE